jgi:hypothetical protein
MLSGARNLAVFTWREAHMLTPAPEAVLPQPPPTSQSRGDDPSCMDSNTEAEPLPTISLHQYTHPFMFHADPPVIIDRRSVNVLMHTSTLGMSLLLTHDMYANVSTTKPSLHMSSFVQLILSSSTSHRLACEFRGTTHTPCPSSIMQHLALCTKPLRLANLIQRPSFSSTPFRICEVISRRSIPVCPDHFCMYTRAHRCLQTLEYEKSSHIAALTPLAESYTLPGVAMLSTGLDLAAVLINEGRATPATATAHSGDVRRPVRPR